MQSSDDHARCGYFILYDEEHTLDNILKMLNDNMSDMSDISDISDISDDTIENMNEQNENQKIQKIQELINELTQNELDFLINNPDSYKSI